MAIVVTVILVLAVAVFDLGRGFYSSMLLEQGVRDGARVAMDCGTPVADIEAAALAAAPAGSSVTIAPSPRPTCTTEMSVNTTTTVTLTYNHQWITPFWGGGGSQTISRQAVSR